MIVFIDLIGLDTKLANTISLNENVVFVHNIPDLPTKEQWGKIKYINIKNAGSVSPPPEYVIIQRNNLFVKIGEQEINTLMLCASLFPKSEFLVLIEGGDSIPREIPPHIPFIAICPNDIVNSLNKFTFDNIGILFDIFSYNTPFDISNILESLRFEKSLSMRIAKKGKQKFVLDVRPTLVEGKLNILHVKRTKLALAPEELIKALQTHCSKEINVVISNVPVTGYDIIHYHNIYVPCDVNKKCIQFHSEPTRVTLNSSTVHNCDTFPSTKFVLAQYHATLKEYKDCVHVRNVINFDTDPLYTLTPRMSKTLKVSYSPSVTTRVNEYFDKGYEATKKILENVKGIEFDIIIGVSLEECLKRKADSDIVIDECVTGSYHRSGLEGLALGKMVICWVNDETKKVMLNAKSKRNTLEIDDRPFPFENIKITELEEFLNDCVQRPIEDIRRIGTKNREWMERWWHPRDIANDYLKFYKNL